MLFTLLSLIFAPAVERTGANLWAVRDRASNTLAAWWPLSEPALSAGRRSLDMEVRKRCERAIPATWRADLAAAGLVSHANERDGLPLAKTDSVPYVTIWTDPNGVYQTTKFNERISGPELRSAVIRLAQAHGIDTSDTYYFGDSQFWSRPTGYDYVRLRLRGVNVGGAPDWCPAGRERMVKEWSVLKGRK